MNDKYNIIRLTNGLRCVSASTEGLVSYIGVCVNAGSRDETPEDYGLAHFVEHTIFKGTLKRRSWQVSNRMESIGGELNAYTSKEETVVYTNCPAGFEERAFELLGDLIENAAFPSAEIDREKEVVIEEIKSYLDSPSDNVYDVYEEMCYEGSGLAHNILGSPDSVHNLSGLSCRRFLEGRYVPENMVLYCVSPLDVDKVGRLVEKYFGHMSRILTDNPVRITPPPVKTFHEIIDKSGHQANTIVGTRLFGRKDPRRYAMFLLNNYLGGPSMNSRLSRELREKRGYVYTVDSSVALFSDIGQLMIYFGCDVSCVEKCHKIITNEIDRLSQSKMSEKKFEAIRRQYCGQLLLSSDHKESRAMSLAKSVMYYDEVIDIGEVTSRINSLNPDDLLEVARLLNPMCFSSLTLQ